mmetsp:Transcript_26081/g.65866  ORF Transcript_26081/g.65866 Transcript_26081/m.65866 type:complete len:132 (-) Transcript_26081:28-423(-)
MSLASSFSRLSLSLRAAARSGNVSRNPALPAAIPAALCGARLASTKAAKKADKGESQADKPKRKPTSYMMFVKAHHAATKRTYSLSFVEVASAISLKWRAMNDAEKAVYLSEQTVRSLDLSPEELNKLPKK